MAKEKKQDDPKQEPKISASQSELRETSGDKDVPDKINVKHGKNVQPSKATIAELAAQQDDVSDSDSSKNTDENEPISQFSTDLSTDPLKDEGIETKDSEGEVEQSPTRLDDREPEFPEIPHGYRVDGLLKSQKNTKKLKVLAISITIGLIAGFGILYALRSLEVL